MIESTLFRHFGEYRSWKMTQCHVHCKLSRVKTIPDTTRSEVQTKTPKFFYSPFFWNLNNLVLRKDPFYIKKNIEERTAFDGMRNLSYFIHNFKFSELICNKDLNIKNTSVFFLTISMCMKQLFSRDCSNTIILPRMLKQRFWRIAYGNSNSHTVNVIINCKSKLHTKLGGLRYFTNFKLERNDEGKNPIFIH